MPDTTSGTPALRSRWAIVSILVLVLVAACGGDGETEGTPGDSIVTVASFDFDESRTLAELYAQAVEANGFPVERALGVGSRELVEPALEQGAVDLVPEYLGSSLEFLNRGMGAPTADTAEAHRLLSSMFSARGVTVLQPAPAENQNVVVVTRAIAERYGLHTVSDLGPIAGELVFGGPPECPQRPLCLLGLSERYGLRFKDVRALDTGGPVTLGALRDNEVQVGVLFTTSPMLTADLVSLEDDRQLQPAENVVPAVRSELLSTHGPRLAQVIDAVSAELDSRSLLELNQQVQIKGVPPERAVKEWLAARPQLLP